jgi:hypothetical protein
MEWADYAIDLGGLTGPPDTTASFEAMPMATANLNISVTEKRMMSESEAAIYCGLPARHFKICCNVVPINLGGKALRYDKRDLDQWIDSEKTGGTETSRDAILARLG